jgi:predicted enzyme related to lactoylglutathione lyase
MERTIQIEGITRHGVTLEPDQFGAMKKLCREVFGLTPMIEQDGWTLFPMQNGTVLDLFEPNSELIPAYGLNDGIVFGFRVDDIAAAAAELQAAGCELLCDAHRIPEMNYAFCHFRGPDGRVYGINEQK